MEGTGQRSIASAYLRPLTLADILDGMFELLTLNWRVYAVALGVVLVPLHFVVSYLTSEVYGGVGLIEQFSNPAAAEAFFAGGPNLGAFLGLIGVSVGSFLLVTPFVNGVACVIAARGYEQRPAETRDVLRTGARRYASLVGVTVLLLLVAVAIAAGPALLIYGAVVTASEALGAAAATLVAVAVVALVFVFVRLSLVYVVVVVEGAGPVAALRRSSQLVAGRFWRVMGTLALTGLIAAFIAQIISLPFAVPGSLFGEWAGVVFTAVGGVLVAILTTPLAANAQTLLYFDGRVRVEGYDLDVFSRDLVAAPVDTGQSLG